MLDVYCDPCTVNSRKVMAGLQYLGTDFKYHHVDYVKQEHKLPDYLKKNPMGTVPCAIHDDCVITESNAILQYAADHSKHQEAYPTDLKARSQVNKWLLWESSAWFPACYVYLVENVVKPLMGGEADQSALDANSERWNQLATILDEQLGKTKWLVGDKPTIADFAVAAPMHLHKASKLPLDKYPNLTKWMTEGMEKLPAWLKTQEAPNQLAPGRGGPTA